MKAIKDQKGRWLFVAPVSGLILSPGINREILINKITFVNRSKMARIRKRLGFQLTVGDLKKKKEIIFDTFFNEAKSFAVCQLGGSGVEKEKEFLKIARDEINILSLSQLGYGRRRLNASLSLSKEKRPGTLSYFMMHTGNKKWTMQNKKSGRFMEITFDKNWQKFQKFSFFYDLLELLRGNLNVSDRWLLDIYNAAVLAGQSQSSSDLPQAFLWNMIAIETLLTHRGDSYSTALPKRVEAFIGWTTDWSVSNFESKIGEVYQKRCKFVHAGQFDEIKIEDLLFTDLLLVNIFYNILKHIDMFRDKDSLIQFSKKVQAEHILGVKPKVRPKSLKFLNMNYSDKDYEGI